jgi:hypothetical protein
MTDASGVEVGRATCFFLILVTCALQPALALMLSVLVPLVHTLTCVGRKRGKESVREIERRAERE